MFMKPFLPIIIISIAVVLFSCSGKKTAEIESTSANGEVKVKIEGKRSVPFDPFKTEITVKAYNFKEGKLLFEITASDLNEQNVKFNWEEETNCVITIEESDKRVRTFKLIANENQMQLAEI